MSRVEERSERWFGTPREDWPAVARRGRTAFVLSLLLRLAVPAGLMMIPMALIEDGGPLSRRKRIGVAILGALGFALLLALGALFEWERLKARYGMPPAETPDA
jgi:hypothetical protein